MSRKRPWKIRKPDLRPEEAEVVAWIAALPDDRKHEIGLALMWQDGGRLGGYVVAQAGLLEIVMPILNRALDNEHFRQDFGVVVGALGCMTELAKHFQGLWEKQIPKPRNRERDREWLRLHEESGRSYAGIAQKASRPDKPVTGKMVEQACRRERGRRERERRRELRESQRHGQMDGEG